MDIKRLVADKEGELSALHNRMDKDLDIYYLTPYVMKDYTGKPTVNVDNVTLNAPQVFADKVIATIRGATPQFGVKGKVNDSQVSKILGFLQGALASADDLLVQKMIVPLHHFFTTQAILRGWIGARTLVWTEGEKVIFDILPLDTRYVTYEVGPKGMAWGAYKTRRSKSQIEEEYDYVARGKYGEVIDFWDAERNIILVDGSTVRETEHKMGKPPFVLCPVALTPLIVGSRSGGMEHYGESVFSAVRQTVEDKNKIATILQTTNMLHFKTPMSFESEDGMKLPEKSPHGAGAITGIKRGERFVAIPYRDVTQAASFFWSIVEGEWQRGTLPAVDYGNLEFPLSAVAISKLTESRDVLFLPRLQAMGLIYRGICHMLIEQFIENGLTAELGEAGEEVEYTPADVEGQYRVSTSFHTVSPEQNIANYSVAAAARGFMSDETIRRDVLKLQDPVAEERNLYEQMAAELVPEVRLYRVALGLLAEAKQLKGSEARAKRVEAMLVGKTIGISLEQLTKGQMPEAPPAPAEGEAAGTEGAPLPGRGAGAPAGASAAVRLLGQRAGRMGLEPSRAGPQRGR